MRRMTKLFFFLLCTSAAVGPMAGCVGETSGYVAYDDPPPPQNEVVVERPGQVFVHGNYVNDSGHWRWHAGHYEARRANQVYVDGRWERHGNQRVWINGGWRAG